MALRAHETSLLTIVRAAMHMFLNTPGEDKPSLHRLRIDEAVKVYPLSTIQRPGLSAERLANSLREYRLLKWSEMLTGHDATALRSADFRNINAFTAQTGAGIHQRR